LVCSTEVPLARRQRAATGPYVVVGYATRIADNEPETARAKGQNVMRLDNARRIDGQ
jgi:hypothetical protein